MPIARPKEGWLKHTQRTPAKEASVPKGGRKRRKEQRDITESENRKATIEIDSCREYVCALVMPAEPIPLRVNV